jgi:hypothetical protein
MTFVVGERIAEELEDLLRNSLRGRPDSEASSGFTDGRGEPGRQRSLTSLPTGVRRYHDASFTSSVR